MTHERNRAEGDVDRIIERRFFEGQNSGVIVDVGAARPDYLSISALFRSKGWRVLSIEPNPDFCEMHRAQGHEVLQYACGDHDADDVDFYVVDSHGAQYVNGQVSFESYSSLGIKESYAALDGGLDKKKIQVRLRRLDTILKTDAPDVEHVDVLSIDVEGWELEVLRGFDVGRFRPRVIVLENLFNEGHYRRYMKAAGYVLWRRVELNDIYVRHADVGAFERHVLSWLRPASPIWIFYRLRRLIGRIKAK